MTKEKTRNLTINEIRQKGYALDGEILRSIMENPIIRDLPQLAEMYGLYGRFIVAQNSLHFAYGIRPEIVNGKFHEYCDYVYPDYMVRKCGYFSFGLKSVLSPWCETVRINNPSSDLTWLAGRFAMIEFMINRYEEYKMDIPEFICVGNTGEHDFFNYAAITDNNTVHENIAKDSFRMREMSMLQECAIWEWPITPSGKKPGSVAFTLSRYANGSEAATGELDALYNHPDKWDECFHSAKNVESLHSCVLLKDAADYVMCGLRKMNIPYDQYDYGKKIKQAQQEDRQLYNRFLTENANMDYVEFAVDQADMGAVNYLKECFTKTKFSPEELELGRKLYYDTNEQREANGETDPNIGSFLFYINGYDMENFREYAQKYNIRFGYPEAGHLMTYYYDGVWLITELHNLPLIEKYRQWSVHLAFSTHRISVKGSAPWELRENSQEPSDVYVSTNSWLGREKGVMNNVPCIYRKDDMVKRGFFVDNENPVPYGIMKKEKIEYLFKPTPVESESEKKPAKKGLFGFRKK